MHPSPKAKPSPCLGSEGPVGPTITADHIATFRPMVNGFATTIAAMTATSQLASMVPVSS